MQEVQENQNPNPKPEPMPEPGPEKSRDDRVRLNSETTIEISAGVIVIRPLRPEAYEKIRESFFALLSGRLVRAIQKVLENASISEDLAALLDTKSATKKSNAELLANALPSLIAAVNELLPSLGDEIPGFLMSVGRELIYGMVSDESFEKFDRADARDILLVRNACLEHSGISELLVLEGNFIARLGNQMTKLMSGLNS